MATGRDYLPMGILSQGSKSVAVTSLVLLLSELSRQIRMIVRTTLQESDKVLSEVSIQHSHPVIYDSYNICELVLNSKLS